MNVEANEFPTGVFVHETRRDWTLQFNDDGSYAFRVNDLVDATGTYVINGNQYTEDTDYLPCRQTRTATYTWAYDGSRLTFHLAGEDNCAERRGSLDGVTWIKQE
jgi:hypothetical protein